MSLTIIVFHFSFLILRSPRKFYTRLLKRTTVGSFHQQMLYLPQCSRSNKKNNTFPIPESIPSCNPTSNFIHILVPSKERTKKKTRQVRRVRAIIASRRAQKPPYFSVLLVPWGTAYVESKALAQVSATPLSQSIRAREATEPFMLLSPRYFMTA